MMNLLLNYSVFKKYDLITEEDKKNITQIISDSYKKVQSNFFYANKCIKNNHTLSEIMGLIIGAKCCKEEKKMKKAYKKLFKEIKKQVLNDGGYIQYSFNYHRLVLQLFEIAFKLEETTKVKIPKDIQDLIYKSIMQLYQVQLENGDVPNYGSNDGSLILPLTVAKYRDFSPPINTLYSYLKNKKLYNNKIYDEEIIWLGKKEALNYKCDKIKRVSSKFEKIGIYTLRNKDIYIMIICNNYKYRPAHMDGLHIDVWYKNQCVFCDAGTYSYADKVGQQLALTEAHNTVQLDNKDQMNRINEFLIYNWTKCRVMKFSCNEFEGILKSKNGYKHMRKIHVDNDKIKINDIVLINSEGKEVKTIFHTPLKMEQENNIITLEGDYNTQIIMELDKDSNVEIDNGICSLYYLIYNANHVLKLEKNVSNKKVEFESEIKFKEKK